MNPAAGDGGSRVRVTLPHHLQTLARCEPELTLRVPGPVTRDAILDALESHYPMLRGTVRDHVTRERRPKVRFFACSRDISHDPPDQPLPDPIARGTEPFMIVGAISGG
ncbi:hypothetical protein [Elongatibacter sediminis]|uniref:MoaD/ThiS family protein n=1 Tax=Elongatibacter sediminis TaxID=3119006 RepID=A0AAW9RCS2_9GAMM